MAQAYRSWRLPTVAAGILTTLLHTPLVSAQIEEVIVTAQRTEESIQDVPIAVTALTGVMLEERGIITPSDLQMTAPNVSFTATNFGGSSFSIRGIGNLVVSAGGQSGVSTHVDDIAVGTNLNAIEFFDVERVEILRGPQGTLYGRNATGGAINMVTRKPDFTEIGGFIDAEAGDYSNQRLKGAFNLPITDNFAIRAAGFILERDGYIDNTAHNQVGVDGSTLTGIDDDVDGRDLHAYRLTASWNPTDRSNVWVQYNRFDEDDDRARVSNQVCKQNDLPTIGCKPDEFGFDTPHGGSNTGGIIFGQFAVLPPGSPLIDGQDGVTYNFPVNSAGFRKMHTDFEPEFQFEEDLYTFGASYEFDQFSVGLIGAYQETDYLARQDYYMDVGVNLPDARLWGITNGNFLGGWPESDAAGDAGADNENSGPCTYAGGTTGVFGGCIVQLDDTNLIVHDQASSSSEFWTVEGKLNTSLDGRFNFLLGASAYDGEAFGDYYVGGNSLDAAGQLLGVFPSIFNVPGDPNKPGTSDGWAAFGEVYYDFTDNLKLTVGARYNEDNKEPNDTGAFFTALDQVTGVVGGFDAATVDLLVNTLGLLDAGYLGNIDDLPNQMARINGSTEILTQPLSRLTSPTFEETPLSQNALNIFEFAGVSQADLDAAAGTPAYSAERVAVSNQVKLIPLPNEARFLTGSPTDDTWEEWTGRIGLDWQVTDDAMIYGFFSRGYKPGGFNTPIAPEFQDSSSFTYDQEEIDAIEIGAKTMWQDGAIMLNGSVFVYDYQGLQVTRIKNNASLNENIDADIWGLELEFAWNPEFAPNLSFDGAYSHLDTELQSGTNSVDVLDPTAGNPDWVVLKDIDGGARAATVFVANVSDLLEPGVIDAALVPNTCVNNAPSTCAPGEVGSASPNPFVPTIDPTQGIGAVGAQSIRNGSAVDGTDYVNGIPSLMSRTYLSEVAGVQVSSGLDTGLDGNSLPNAPENTFRLGAQYTWAINLIRGDLTFRWDYYWQDDSYAREFNTKGDEIESWDQHNASLIYESANGNWQARAFIRNIEDEDNVTGHYVTSDTPGFFRNYFLTEPRIYGASVRYSFGGG